jgi:sec-independent protein translocase protein TatA
MTEVLVVAFVALLVFGASRVPAIGDALGRAVSGARRGSRGGGAPEARTPVAPPRADEKSASPGR